MLVRDTLHSHRDMIRLVGDWYNVLHETLIKKIYLLYDYLSFMEIYVNDWAIVTANSEKEGMKCFFI